MQLVLFTRALRHARQQVAKFPNLFASDEGVGLWEGQWRNHTGVMVASPGGNPVLPSSWHILVPGALPLVRDFGDMVSEYRFNASLLPHH